MKGKRIKSMGLHIKTRLALERGEYEKLNYRTRWELRLKGYNIPPERRRCLPIQHICRSCGLHKPENGRHKGCMNRFKVYEKYARKIGKKPLDVYNAERHAVSLGKFNATE